MEKHCWICNHTEDFFLKQKEDLLQSIEKELSDCEKAKQSIIETAKEKLGFTDVKKEKLKSIPSVYSEMTLNAVLENRDNFLKLEPTLNIVLEYCKTYGKSNFKTVKDVIESYLQEPIKCRYQKELYAIEQKIRQLVYKKEKLEKIKTFFIEKEITPESLDSELNKLKRKPENYESYRRRGSYYSTTLERNKKEPDLSFSYAELGFSFTKKILICPFCMSLFAEASNASFDVVEAQRKAQYEEDQSQYDDD